MAPRGRPRKSPKGQRRMDAALDAMRVYGFPEKLIVATIKELLDVYGVEGWLFIEEASYKVLLDNILEKVEKVEKEKKEKDASLPSDNEGGDNTKASAAGSSTTALVPLCCIEETRAIELQPTVASETVPLAMKFENAIIAWRSECNASVPSGEREGGSWMDMKVEHDCKKELKNNGEGPEGGSSHAGWKVKRKSQSLDQPGICPQALAKAFPTQRRRPYHGWVGRDDEEIVLVKLEPAPLPQKLVQFLSRIDVSSVKKRRRRWDVKPEDV